MKEDLKEKKVEDLINIKKDILNWIFCIIFSIIIVTVFFIFIGTVSTVDGASMENTLFDGDKLFVSKITAEYKYGDIVIIKKDNHPQEQLVKRIIATGGDVVSFDSESGEVYVNNVLLEEYYIKGKTYLSETVESPITIPQGEYFVMGDNRNNSLDSRNKEISTIKKDEIKGKAIFIVYPFNRIAKVK